LARLSLPQLDGTLRVNGLARPVTVIRDAYGVPHIRGENLKDVLFAQGYVTGQDRFWQMDMTRRFAAGELAEILGSDLTKTDRAPRILSLGQVAEGRGARLTAEERGDLDAYVRGVNAWLQDNRHRLPIEFRVLRYSPRPWSAVDSYLVGASMAQMLSHDLFASELTREKIVQRIGPELAAGIYPNTSWRDRPPGGPGPHAATTSRGVDFLYPERFRASGSDEGPLPPKASVGRGIPRFARNDNLGGPDLPGSTIE